jgi:type I restriction enzyme, S subunit
MVTANLWEHGYKGDWRRADWNILSVDAIKAKHQGSIAIGPFGSRMKSNLYVPFGVPVIRGNNISETRSLVGDFVYVANAVANGLKASNVFPGDLFFPHRGAIGQVGIVPRGQADRYVLSSSLMKLTCDVSMVSPTFLFYFFRSPLGRHELLKNASTVGTPGIGQPLASLRSIKVLLPPLPEQRAIAHILGTLDDKIELNRQMNETLEAMARALFKSWFVDFEPVRAKAEGRDPGLPRHIADLFPDSFVESELGEIPAGWEVGPILKIASLLSGGTPKTDRADYWGGDISWSSAKDVSQATDSLLVETERTITERGLKESATQIIPVFSTVVVARGATTGRLVLLGKAMAMNQTCYALATTAAAPFTLYCQLRQEIGGIVNSAHGSVFDTITTSTFSSSKVVLAQQPVFQAFERLIEPLFLRILTGVSQCSTLANLRDTLLPKLLSGEIRIPDAERLVGLAT